MEEKDQNKNQEMTEKPSEKEASANNKPNQPSQGFGQNRPMRGRGPNRPGGRGPRRGRGRGFGDRAKSEYEQKVIDIARVTRVTKGGKRFSFRATVVIGDGKGKIGVGTGKGNDVAQSIQKAFNKAKRNLVTVPMVGGSIPYQVEAKYNSAKVLLKPAKSGVKAGGPVRIVAQLVGLKSLTGKLLSRTNNKLNIAKATIKALSRLQVSKIRTKSTEQLKENDEKS